MSSKLDLEEGCAVHWGARLSGLGIGLGLVAWGCSSPRTLPSQSVAVSSTGFAPTDPSRVELIPWAPARSYQRLGEITITPAPQSKRGDLEMALKDSAASLGAHAVFVVSDPRHRLEIVQVQPLPEEQSGRYPTNAIVAEAIRY